MDMRNRLFALCFIVMAPSALFGGAADKRLDIYWVDVEGGAATLIVTPAGESLLVDAGWPEERDAKRIAKVAGEIARLKRIDHLIVSHWHRDHFGGIEHLSRLLQVKNFYDRGLPKLPKPDIDPTLVEAYKRVTDGKSTLLKPGDQIKLKQAQGAPKLTLRVLAANGIVIGEGPDAPQIRQCPASPRHEAKPIDNSDNASSIAFALSFGDWELFDAGDLTWNVEHKLVCPKNLVGAVDVYQVTHHGLDSSNNPAIVQALQPRIAIINNGPRKGGAPQVVRLLKSTRSIEAIFAVHRNVQTGPEDNAPAELTANDDEQCEGEYIKLSVAQDGKSYTVTVPGKGTVKTFATR